VPAVIIQEDLFPAETAANRTTGLQSKMRRDDFMWKGIALASESSAERRLDNPYTMQRKVQDF
jgi:hypothetical protein